jgi:hypothetical protein
MENFFSEIIVPILVMIIVFINIIRKSSKQKTTQVEESTTENFPSIPSLEKEPENTDKFQTENSLHTTIVQEEKLKVKTEKTVSKIKKDVSSFDKKEADSLPEQEQNTSINLSSADDFKKAVIYSEILNKKF